MADSGQPNSDFLLNLMLRAPNTNANSYQRAGIDNPYLMAMLDSINGGRNPADGFTLDRMAINGTVPISDGLSASAGVNASQERHSDYRIRSASPNVSLQAGPARLGAAYDIANFHGYGVDETSGAPRISPGMQFGVGDGAAYLNMDRSQGAPNQFSAGYETPFLGGTLEAGANYTPQTRLLSALLNYKRKF